MYTQWQIAAERAWYGANGTAEQFEACHEDDSKLIGRGRPPRYNLQSISEHVKPIEKLLWSLPSTFSFYGTDLYTTLWSTIGGMLLAISHARHYDMTNNSVTATLKVSKQFSLFTQYLVHFKKSLIINSLAKLKLEPDRWLYILEYPFAFNAYQCDEYYTEATNISKQLNTIATADTRSAFEETISESITQGGSWIHKWTKGEQIPSPALNGLMGHTLHTPNLFLKNIPLLGPTNGAPIIQPNLKKLEAYSAPSLKLPESIIVTAQLSSHQLQSPD